MWFSTKCSYKGRGKAEFSDIKRTIEGETEISFDESGECTATMKVENLTTNADLPFELFQNTCSSLSVVTADGTFSSTEGIFFSYTVTMFDSSEATISFHLLRSHFDTSAKTEAVYWVMPLCNFVSKYVHWGEDIDKHPMRFRQGTDSAVDNPLTNRMVIAFLFNQRIAYIEPLLEYQNREEKLKEGREQVLITAVMVGEICGSSIDVDQIDNWRPADLLRILSLATGTSVGAPWIEFRDASGKLIRRIHVKMDIRSFSKGHNPIREGIHSGVGYLMTRYVGSLERNKPFLTVLLKHAVQGAARGGTIEDNLTYLFRAFEGLLDYHGFKTQNLIKNLDPVYSNAVKTALNTAATAIRNQAHLAKSAGLMDQYQVLNRIAERASQASNKDKHFGIAMYELLQHYRLPDAGIVDTHIISNPRPDGLLTFGALLSKYRGSVIHESYFSFSSGVYDFSDVIQIKDHLLDIILRIIFQIVGYDGTYQPPIIRLSASEKTDWVNVSTTATTLGYK